MKFESPNNFEDAKEVESAQDSTENMLSHEEGYEDPDHVSEERLIAAEELMDLPALTPEQASELSAVLDSLELKAAKRHITPPVEAQAQEVPQEAVAEDEKVSSYAPPEALGIDIPTTVKESEVLYPGADPFPHKKIEEKDVANMGEKAANPHGFKEVA